MPRCRPADWSAECHVVRHVTTAESRIRRRTRRPTNRTTGRRPPTTRSTATTNYWRATSSRYSDQRCPSSRTNSPSYDRPGRWRSALAGTAATRRRPLAASEEIVRSPSAGPWSWSSERHPVCSVWRGRTRRWVTGRGRALGTRRWRSLSGWCRPGSGPVRRTHSDEPRLQHMHTHTHTHTQRYSRETGRNAPTTLDITPARRKKAKLGVKLGVAVGSPIFGHNDNIFSRVAWNNKMLSYRRETALQSTLVLAESGRL